jgi:hypothetical protein
MSHGKNFSKDVHHKFGSTVNPSERSGHFLMVVSFGRAAFRLNEEIVAAALESILGGNGSKMKISFLRDRVFSFCVSGKQVGFHILKLRMYRCSLFKCFFHLWGRGGPNWEREFNLLQSECQSEWTLVSPGKKREQMAMKAMEKPVPRPVVKTTVSEGKKLNFAEAISYPACKGYKEIVTVHPDISQSADISAPQDDKVQSAAEQTCSSSAQAKESGGSIQSSKDKDKQPDSDGSLDKTNSEQPRSLDGLDEVIDDIAYRFWECGRCLSMGHDSKSCTKRVRCRFCFRSGHFRKTCLDWLKQKKQAMGPQSCFASPYSS